MASYDWSWPPMNRELYGCDPAGRRQAINWLGLLDASKWALKRGVIVQQIVTKCGGLALGCDMVGMRQSDKTDKG